MSYPANPPPYSPPGPEIRVVHIQPVHSNYVISAPVMVSSAMGPSPGLTVCKYCNHQVVTSIEMRPSCMTHLWALCLFAVGFWPCMCIPYCTPSCMNVDHYCSNCSAHIGSYRN